ncbi:type VI secretion system contractile sheath small subunit [Vibrio profundum]|uniref:type VI secretion system contractile sheath small subunit n=1 Tax=Vibrio profundum TaxID=2910247 RepID=UPI003D0B95FD
MAKESSVAPQERVNIVYQTEAGNAKQDIELPLKMLVVGDFTLAEDERMVEDRTPINVDKDNFNEVLKGQGLNLEFSVPKTLAGASEGEQLPVNLSIDQMKDFEPDQIIRQIPEIAKLMELRDALKALKSPLSNVPEFRKKVQSLIQNEESRQALLKELGIDKVEAE